MNSATTSVAGPDVVPVAARPARSAERRRSSRWSTRAAGPLTTTVLSLLAMAQALRVWEWRPGTPLGMTGDAPWIAALVRGYIAYGPYADNPIFGAPYSLNTGWSSTGDDAHIWILSAIGLFSSNPYTVMALYFMAVFPLSALSMYWLCRQYDVMRPAAVMAGVLFSVLPGQQERFVHLFLAAYWAVPFAAWILIESAAGNSVLSRRAGWRATGWRVRRPRLALTTVVLICLAVGLGDVYYVAFTLVLGLPVIIVRQLRKVDIRELGSLLLPLICVALPAAVSLAASRRRADRDLLTGSLPFGRSFADTERWSGQLVDLLLPWSGHRLSGWASHAASFDGLTGTVGEVSSIGMVATIGVCAALLFAAAVLIKDRDAHAAHALILRLAVLSVVAMAFFTRGGLGALTAVLLTPQIRTWSRLFLFVALFGLLAIAWILTLLGRRRDVSLRMSRATCAVLLCLGVLDQTNPDHAPAWEQNRVALSVITRFDNDVEEALGSDCSVFVLPIADFPEVDDTPWRPIMSLVVASRDLQWSFGAIKGTAHADWQKGLPLDDAARLADDLAAIGYCGVAVESTLSSQHPRLFQGLPRLLGAPVATSSDGRFSAYSLRSTRQYMQAQLMPSALRARADTALHPVIASLSGAWALGDLSDRRYPLGPSPSVRLANMRSTSTTVTLALDLMGPGSGTERVCISGDGVAGQVVELGARKRGTVSVRVALASGMSSLFINRCDGHLDWLSYTDPSALSSVVGMRLTTEEPDVNTGVDLPSR